MSQATTSDTGVPLAATVTDDGALYRVAQALLALASAPGRRNLRLTEQHGRWDVYGLSRTTTRYPPPTLVLDAGLSHRAHLHALLLAPLAEEAPQFTTNTSSRLTYAVQRDGLPALFTATHALAGALDAVDDAQREAWWKKRARQQRAREQRDTALRGLRDVAGNVMLIQLR